ncbi:5-oxoprolinase subunit B family protein [Thioalkalivibrio sp. HK1]|uniref:5-oxoprolinase subunit B family protein n=1 Tax=Thioalkalivibrio sp. HK1 TaxID=1469245 RepID=UPI0004B57D21|nr:allophanate hydrolase subunit 1 [Thioalkalivibrio sp. HK1]
MGTSLKFLPSGDTGLTVQVGTDIDKKTSAAVMRLRSAIEAAALPGVIEIVPAYLSLLVHYDPLKAGQFELIEAIEALNESTVSIAEVEPKAWSFPVCFEGEDFAPDIETVAQWAGLAPEDVISDIVGADQFVYMIGFAPGQPYIGDLPDRIAIPRRKDPISGIEAGSVVIATGKTVIYSVMNPTGWYVVGRTPVPIFDRSKENPVLLHAGDSVSLRAVDRYEFESIRERIIAGRYDPMSDARV